MSEPKYSPAAADIAWGLTNSAAHELARLAARMAELEAENAKLRACVKASDDARGDGCCPVCDSEAGADHWIDCPWRDYDAARAGVGNG